MVLIAAMARGDVGDSVVAGAATADPAPPPPAPRRRRRTTVARNATANRGDVDDSVVAGAAAADPAPPQPVPEMRPSTVWTVPSVADTTPPQFEVEVMLASSTSAQERPERLQEGIQAQRGMSNRDILQRLDTLLGSSNESDDAPSDSTSESDLGCNHEESDADIASHTRRSSDLAEVITTDINMSHDEDQGVYKVLDSDASSDEEPSGYEEDTTTQFSGAPWTDATLSSFTEEMGNSINDDDAILKLAKNRNEIKGWETAGWEQVPGTLERQPEYRGLYKGAWGRCRDVLDRADSPIELFWYFFPKSLLQRITDESNRYAQQTVVARAKEIRDRQLKCKRGGTRTQEVETLKQIRQRLRSMKRFSVHEYSIVFGLLIARMLCPQKRRLSSHWSTSSTGAIPAGTFGQWMPRNRFDELMQHLHFSDNKNPMAAKDRAWKIRPVVETLQETFIKGYIPGSVISFDEGMLPSHSKYNGTRMFMKDKPHKWGTKLFLTCCPTTAYCMRLEVYCGKKAHLGGKQTIDDKSGPAAVLRNLEMVLPNNRQDYRTVVVDRFYTSVALALELLSNKIYVVGTIQTRRIGFPTALKDKRKKRPSDIPRGAYTIARCKAVPDMLACCWWDSKPVHLLATGASVQQLTTVHNTWVEGEASDIPCPKLVKDYHNNMGGVDVHDQLRLQRYSVQMAFIFKSTTRRKFPLNWTVVSSCSNDATLCSLFLGLLDLALVNAFIVHREHYKRSGRRGMTHAEFLTNLHAQLLSIKKEDFLQENESYLTPTLISRAATRRTTTLSGHEPTQTEDFQGDLGASNRKRMQRACKVCSMLAPQGHRGKNTKWFCEACSEHYTGDVYLCQLIRHDSFGVKKSCFAIWHEDWDCGKTTPVQIDKRLQYRKPTGKKKASFRRTLARIRAASTKS